MVEVVLVEVHPVMVLKVVEVLEHYISIMLFQFHREVIQLQLVVVARVIMGLLKALVEMHQNFLLHILLLVAVVVELDIAPPEVPEDLVVVLEMGQEVLGLLQELPEVVQAQTLLVLVGEIPVVEHHLLEMPEIIFLLLVVVVLDKLHQMLLIKAPDKVAPVVMV